MHSTIIRGKFTKVKRSQVAWSNTKKTKVTFTEERGMRSLRQMGATLQVIATVFHRSIPTVFHHTINIGHDNRHNKTVTINRRSGMVA